MLFRRLEADNEPSSTPSTKRRQFNIKKFALRIIIILVLWLIQSFFVSKTDLSQYNYTNVQSSVGAYWWVVAVITYAIMAFRRRKTPIYVVLAWIVWAIVWQVVVIEFVGILTGFLLGVPEAEVLGNILMGWILTYRNLRGAGL